MATNMRIFIRLYDYLVYAMAGIAGLSLVVVFLTIIADVTLRTLHLPSIIWASTVSEYSMLIAVMGAAPLLIRERRHVWVSVIESMASRRVMHWLDIIAIWACVTICVVVAFSALDLAAEAASRGENDIRSIVVPRWVLYGIIGFSFTVCALEFIRFAIRHETICTEDLPHEESSL